MVSSTSAQRARLCSPRSLLLEHVAPQQENAYDCGVFTCRNALAITMLKDQVFSYRDIHLNKDFFNEHAVFNYDHGEIDKIREQMLTLIERLSIIYKSWKAEQLRQKQAAKEAKDLACADRPGGKFLCIRNPFSTGF